MQLTGIPAKKRGNTFPVYMLRKSKAFACTKREESRFSPLGSPHRVMFRGAVVQPIKTPVYQIQQVREIEQRAREQLGLSSQTLMQRAGKAAFEFLLRRFPQAQKIAVFCGSGNNGGDGYVVAQLAHERGLQVTLWQVGNPEKMSPEKMSKEARVAFEACHAIPTYLFHEQANLNHPDLVIDAICGIGLKETLREEVVKAIATIHNLNVPIFSLDVPTGIEADTGRILGSAIHATATITFLGLKLGLVTASGLACAGELALNDLQVPASLFSQIEPAAEKLELSAFSSYLKPRFRDWHKGLSGHVLVVGGGKGYAGAARMAAVAALRIGAGLVSVATHPDHAMMMNTNCPEIMCHGVSSAKEIQPLVEKADVIILGPGLGQTEWAKTLWASICASELPLLLDADALNLLAQTNLYHNNWVLTPHPGEAARLLSSTVDEVQNDRLTALKTIQKRYGGVCVLKGAGSLILSPSSLPVVCTKGNPGMSSAGMGDILSGVIGGLMAQRIPLGDAAKLGVYLHAMAGDLAAKEGERGMLATDLYPYLRRLVNQL